MNVNDKIRVKIDSSSFIELFIWLILITLLVLTSIKYGEIKAKEEIFTQLGQETIEIIGEDRE